MWDFLLNTVLWTLALYGLFEIVKTIINIYTYTKLKSDGIYVIIAVKNQEDKIEGFLRNFIFRVIYGNEENIKNVIITDLDSTDDTPKIIDRIQKENSRLKVTNWKTCKEVIESIKNV